MGDRAGMTALRVDKWGWWERPFAMVMVAANIYDWERNFEAHYDMDGQGRHHAKIRLSWHGQTRRNFEQFKVDFHFTEWLWLMVEGQRDLCPRGGGQRTALMEFSSGTVYFEHGHAEPQLKATGVLLRKRLDRAFEDWGRGVES